MKSNPVRQRHAKIPVNSRKYDKNLDLKETRCYHGALLTQLLLGKEADI